MSGVPLIRLSYKVEERRALVRQPGAAAGGEQQPTIRPTHRAMREVTAVVR
jgi:hypothetical protein